MAENKVFYTEQDLPLADKSKVVTQVIEHGVEIERKVFAGTRVPPDLIDAYKDGKVIDDPAPEPDRTAGGSTDYSAMSVEDLQELADERKLEVTGTGKDGNVLKSDLLAALAASD